MAARKDNKKRLEQRQAEHERARQKQASKQAAAAQAQRAAQQEEIQRLQRQAAAQDPAARAAAQKRYVEMVNAAPEYQRSLLDLTVPPSLRTAQAAGRYLFTKSADLLGLGI
jgi:hypothetical protein